MKKIKSLRKLAVPLIAFSFGLLINGQWPDWARVAIPTLWLLWLMAYDEAVYQEEERRKFTK